MTSEELAAEVDRMAELACNRVMGTGHDQYYNDGEQKFEKLSPRELLIELEEEVADVMVYSVMSLIRVRQLVHATAKYTMFDITEHPDYATLKMHHEAALKRLDAVDQAVRGNL